LSGSGMDSIHVSAPSNVAVQYSDRPLSRMGRLPVSIVLKNIQQSLGLPGLAGRVQPGKSAANSELAGKGVKVLSRSEQTAGQQSGRLQLLPRFDAVREVQDGRYHGKSASGRR
jgi:hypothetical protein